LRLPLPHPRIREAAPRGDGGDEGNSSSREESPLYGDRDRVARLLRDDTLDEEEVSAGLPDDLPLGCSAGASDSLAPPRARAAGVVLDLRGDRGETETEA